MWALFSLDIFILSFSAVLWDINFVTKIQFQLSGYFKVEPPEHLRFSKEDSRKVLCVLENVMGRSENVRYANKYYFLI